MKTWWVRHPTVLPLIVAVIVRGVRMAGFVPLIEADGCEYLRLAENLLSGRGYVGLHGGDTQLMFPPLYPLLIAGITWGTGLSPEISARSLSFLASLVTVALVGCICRRLGGPRACVLGCWMAALQPFLIVTGVATFSEALQIALLVFAAHLVLRTRRHGDLTACLAGPVLGLACSTRVESLPLALVMVCVVTARSWREGAWVGARRGALVLVGIAMSVAPYAIVVGSATGSAEAAPKAARVLAVVLRQAQGMEPARAYFEISEEGEPVGPWVAPIGRWHGPSAWALLRSHGASILAHGVSRIPDVLWLLASGHTLTSLPMLILGVSAVAALWRRQRAPAVLLSCFFLGGLGMGLVYRSALRYFAWIAPASSALAALGLTRWIGRRHSKTFSVLCAVVIAATAARGFVTGLREFDEGAIDGADPRELASVLQRSTLRRGVVASADSRAAYYAGLDWVITPVPPNPAALRLYLTKQRVEFLIVETERGEGMRSMWTGPSMVPPGLSEVARLGSTIVYRLP